MLVNIQGKTISTEQIYSIENINTIEVSFVIEFIGGQKKEVFTDFIEKRGNLRGQFHDEYFKDSPGFHKNRIEPIRKQCVEKLTIARNQLLELWQQSKSPIPTIEI